jgi:hypothetical protein
VKAANDEYLATFQKEINLRREHHAAVEAKKDLVFPEVDDDDEPAPKPPTP